MSAFNRFCGVDVHEICPHEVKELFPLARTDDIEAGFYVKERRPRQSGRRDHGAGQGCAPCAACRSSSGWRSSGCRRPAATGRRCHRRAHRIRGHQGRIRRQLHGHVGAAVRRARRRVNSPPGGRALLPDHRADQGVPPNMPVLEDPASYGYYREEGGGIMVGLFEPTCAPWKIEGIPADVSFLELAPDWDRMAPVPRAAMARVPITAEVGHEEVLLRPGELHPRPAPDRGRGAGAEELLRGRGPQSVGVLTGGGLGRVLANWIIEGVPDVDVKASTSTDCTRYQSNPEYRRERTVESLGMVYKTHYPNKSLTTARGVRKVAVSRAPGRRAARTSRRSAAGRARTGTPDRATRPDPGPLSWGRESWFPRWRAEHQAARENVIVMDMSFMGKFLVQGRDAGQWLNRISANHVDGDAGVITYTQWLNAKGLLEADLTVTKLADEKYFVVVTDTMVRHAETWMKRNIPDERACLRHRRHLRLRAAERAGAALARAAAEAHQRDLGTRPSRSVPRARSTSASRACCACASPTWVNWATSCTSPPNRPCTSTTASSRRARSWACARRAQGTGQPAHGEGLP